MSKFNHYARALESIAAEGFAKLRAGQEKLDRARQEFGKYPAVMSTNIMDAKKAREIANAAEAKARLYEAERDYNDLRMNGMESYLQRIEDIREELQEAITEEFSVKPERLDENTISLLKSGILTVDEYERLMEKSISAGNHTMSRMIAAYAQKEADKKEAEGKDWRDPATMKLREVARLVPDGAEYLSQYDTLVDVARRCLDNPGMVSHWESLTADLVEEF